MDDKTLKALLGAQQGELDAVLMYQKIAARIKDPDIKAILLDAAKDEGRHASVFHKLTNVVLKPKSLQANAVVFLMYILGKKRTFKIISSFEYKAKDSYEPLIKDFPEIESVAQDEVKHGDHMLELSKRF